MKSIVIGAGKLGFEVAKRLVFEGHEVTVIDQDAASLQELDENLDVLTVHGNGCSPDVLEKALAKNAGLFVAVTNSDEVNIVGSMLAKQLGVKTTVARIRNKDYRDTKTSLKANRLFGIDLVIDPEEAVAYEIVKLLRASSATAVQYFVDGQVQMIGFGVQQNAPIANKTVQQTNLTSSTVAVILRDDAVLVPKGDTRLLAGDEVFVIGRTGNSGEIGWLSGKSDQIATNIVIIGGGKTGFALARDLERHRRRFSSVRIIERDEHVCEQLAAELRHTLIIHGDGTDLDLLVEERIGEADAVVSVTNNEQTNLVAGFIVKHIGARRAISLLRRQDYAAIAEAMGIDATVTPRVCVSSAILSLLHRGRLDSLSLLKDGRLEAIELTLSAQCAACKKPLRSLGLPEGIVVGAVMRKGKVLVPRGDTVLGVGDHVVLFAAPAVSHLVHRYFLSE